MKLKLILLSFIIAFTANSNTFLAQTKNQDRQFYVDAMLKIAHPVLDALSKNELKKIMPVEISSDAVNDRSKFTHLEAFGRTLSGIAPWLELGLDASDEGKLRKKYILMTLQCLKNATNPTSADYLNFSDGSQALVDAAFLAQGLLRAPTQLWERLDINTQKNILIALKKTRRLSPGYNNWLLFTAMIEAAILKFEGEADMVRIQYALNKHKEWYLGDGIYGDGPNFHWDYYNSFVIHPMLLDIWNVLISKKGNLANWRYENAQSAYDEVLNRAKQYAIIQEKLISPEGTYPPIGRSLTYRFGAFQALSQIALFEKLPTQITPSQVRSAFKAVIKKHLEAKDMFDENGWLTIGFYGHQPEMAERYISTGSLYICTEIFLVLGLASDNLFWTDNSKDWSQKKIWAKNK
ncbi:DUF2264 domain-containing protein [Polaribacter glomeratus]|uniref:DUF2264 domain-containing protein n=1 Tax=Polaribacter glomeratus TaxID=102 RepID=A0A2S7WG56_9FLAO|nr:DUF2264 domain-containing protein [Polaribacter glomeratus]PQJ76584.1 hypothetical protein BTO16_11850 [Polaribacter glomeratus]TXD67580.1 DUF2264 domain-containing protein [Polaribacter glomeratus]